MKKTLFVFTILFIFVSLSFPSPKGDGQKHVIFGGTTAGQIFVRDYMILSSGRWDQVRELFFDSKGPVGTVTGTRPNDQGDFSIFYTYESQQQILARNVRIDFDDFKIKSDTPLNINLGNFGIGAWRIEANLSNRTRLNYAESDHDVVTQKVRDSNGKPFTKRTQIFNNDDQWLPIASSFAWDGTHSAQIIYHQAQDIFVGDFRSVTPAGKPGNDLKRYGFNNDVFNISVSRQHNFTAGLSYTVATRDHKLEGSTHKTAIALTRFDASNHMPVDSRLVHGFRTVPAGNILNATLLNTIYLYDAFDRNDPGNSHSYLIYGLFKKGKLQTFLQEYDPFTLNKKFNQTLVGRNDPILRNSDYFYGYYAVGFYVQ